MKAELRMTLAEGQEETVTAKHVQVALDDCSYLNSLANTWAELDIVPTPTGQVIHMRVGSRELPNGYRQKAFQMVAYFLDKDGEVKLVKHHLP